MNKPAIPSWSVLKNPEKYVHSTQHSDPKQFRERLRTADYFPRQSDGRDGNDQIEERDE